MRLEHNKQDSRIDLFDDDGTHMGEIIYRCGKNLDLYATSTEVFSPYEGRGLAGQLLDALVAYAVQENKKIVPLCSYVVSAFKKFPEKYAAVLP